MIVFLFCKCSKAVCFNEGFDYIWRFFINWMTVWLQFTPTTLNWWRFDERKLPADSFISFWYVSVLFRQNIFYSHFIDDIAMNKWTDTFGTLFFLFIKTKSATPIYSANINLFSFQKFHDFHCAFLSNNTDTLMKNCVLSLLFLYKN